MEGYRGCTPCKERKATCTLDGPPCRNCIRLGQEGYCLYDTSHFFAQQPSRGRGQVVGSNQQKRTTFRFAAPFPLPSHQQRNSGNTLHYPSPLERGSTRKSTQTIFVPCTFDLTSGTSMQAQKRKRNAEASRRYRDRQRNQKALPELGYILNRDKEPLRNKSDPVGQKTGHLDYWPIGVESTFLAQQMCISDSLPNPKSLDLRFCYAQLGFNLSSKQCGHAAYQSYHDTNCRSAPADHIHDGIKTESVSSRQSHRSIFTSSMASSPKPFRFSKYCGMIGPSSVTTESTRDSCHVTAKSASSRARNRQGIGFSCFKYQPRATSICKTTVRRRVLLPSEPQLK